jgi:hypothetical protein
METLFVIVENLFWDSTVKKKAANAAEIHVSTDMDSLHLHTANVLMEQLETLALQCLRIIHVKM